MYIWNIYFQEEFHKPAHIVHIFFQKSRRYCKINKLRLIYFCMTTMWWRWGSTTSVTALTWVEMGVRWAACEAPVGDTKHWLLFTAARVWRDRTQIPHCGCGGWLLTASWRCQCTERHSGSKSENWHGAGCYGIYPQPRKGKQLRPPQAFKFLKKWNRSKKRASQLRNDIHFTFLLCS